MADQLLALIPKLHELGHGLYEVVLKHRIPDGCTWERVPYEEGKRGDGGELLFYPHTLFAEILFTKDGKHHIEFQSTHLSSDDDCDDFVLISDAEPNTHHQYDPYGSIIVYQETFTTLPTLEGLRQEIQEVVKVYTYENKKPLDLNKI